MRGNPGKRSLNKREAKLPAAMPQCPEHLDDMARKEWDRIVPQLFASGLCADADMASLAVYCQAFSDWCSYQKQLQKHGSLIKTPTGFVQQSPLVGMANQAGITVAKLAREFGMTPSARSSINAAPPNEKADDPWAALG